MTNLFKKGMLVLLGVGTMIACSDDDTTSSGGNNSCSGTATEITDLDFTSIASGSGNIITVQASATGACSYDIDFGDDSDVITDNPGTKETHTYPETSATYTIKVTASGDGLDDVIKEKDVEVTYLAPSTLADFEDNPDVGFSLESGAITATTEDATDNANGNGKVGRIVYEEAGDGWKSSDLVFANNIDLAESTTITMDFYNAEAVSVPVVLKLSEVVYPESEGADKIDCQVMTSAVAGWQKLTFDFDKDGYASGDSNGKPLIFEGPQWGAVNLFIGVTIMTGANTAGTYEIDNLAGAGWGDVKDTTDTDGDGVIDTEDNCPNVAAEEGKDADNDGCTDPDTTQSSSASEDFEGALTLFWNDDAATREVVSNSFSGAGNDSDKILKYTDAGGQYANLNFNLSSDNTVKFDLTTKHVFTVNVYVPTPAEAVSEPKQLVLKLQDGSAEKPWEGQTDVTQPYVYDQWQTLTFDFSEVSDETKYSRIVVQFNGENNNESCEGYIDDILLK
jgi:hypothetical protein